MSDIYDQSDIVNVVVTQRPQRVFVVINDRMHVGKWRTVEPGESGVDPIGDSQTGLLRAAMMFWSGQSHFTTTIQELEKHSGGWGVD